MTGTLSQRLAHSASFALIASITILSLILMSFMMAEPKISYGQVLEDTQDFTVRQQITDESSFTTNPSNVTMVGAINGLTGGNATGSTGFRVRSNNATGWLVTIEFFDNAGDEAMYGETDGDESIRDFVVPGGEPIWGFGASTSARFAYSVTASSASDLDQSFKHNNSSTCGGAFSFITADRCWMAPTQGSEFTILDSGGADPVAASSTITFKVNVPSGAVPPPSAQWYTATATLSLYTQ